MIDSIEAQRPVAIAHEDDNALLLTIDQLSDDELLTLLCTVPEDGVGPAEAASPPQNSPEAQPTANLEEFWEEVAALHERMLAQWHERPVAVAHPLAWGVVNASLRALHGNSTRQSEAHRAPNRETQAATDPLAVSIAALGRSGSKASGESHLVAMRARTAELAHRATLAALALQDSALRAPFRI
jgi:hypothetical protein